MHASMHCTIMQIDMFLSNLIHSEILILAWIKTTFSQLPSQVEIVNDCGFEIKHYDAISIKSCAEGYLRQKSKMMHYSAMI